MYSSRTDAFMLARNSDANFKITIKHRRDDQLWLCNPNSLDEELQIKNWKKINPISKTRTPTPIPKFRQSLNVTATASMCMSNAKDGGRGEGDTGKGRGNSGKSGSSNWIQNCTIFTHMMCT